MRVRDRHRRVSIRGQLVLLLLALGGLLGLLISLTTLQVQGGDREKTAESARVTQLELADSMRQSSNDLTRMVQLYVSTGESRYRSYYNQILAIRGGSAPRPLGYTSSFWDEVLAHGMSSVRYGPPQSLEAQMRAARFTADEFAALDASLQASNQLAQLELRVMGTVAPRIARGVDATYPTDVAPAYRQLVDQGYLNQKGVIMAAIERFINLVNAHTLASVRAAQADNRRLFLLEFAVLAVGLVIGLLAFRRARRVLLGPLTGLIGVTRRIADGEYAGRARPSTVAELEDLAGAFNDMARAIESDITRRRIAEGRALQAQREAERASEAKSTFLAAMSHEIRTPMTGVTGMLELLGHTKLTGEQQEMVGVARDSADSLLGIIGDILDLSKIEAGRVELCARPFRMTALLSSLVASWHRAAAEKGLDLRWSADDGLASVHIGDELRLRQVIGNLLSNAVKFTAQGHIRLAAILDGGAEGQQTVRITVADTGPGVPAWEMAGLFAAYQQASSALPLAAGQRWAGTGLGLVLSRQIARLMHGELTMESEPGVGTTLVLTIPLAVGLETDHPTPQMPPRLRPSARNEDLRGRTLLLAEDHPFSRQVLVRQFSHLGFEVEVVNDGEAALARFTSGPYGAVFTDLNMPGLGGLELTMAIRRHEAVAGLARTPVFALTANALSEEAVRCLAAGMDGVTTKPTTIAALGDRLRRALPDLPWAPEPSGVEDLVDGDPVLGKSILADFRSSAAADVADMLAAVDNGDVAGLARSAHRLRGAAAMVGAADLTRDAAEIERLARSGVVDAEGVRSLGVRMAGGPGWGGDHPSSGPPALGAVRAHP